MLCMPHTLYHHIRHHAVKSHPHECCGILLGTREQETRTVYEVLPVENVHPASPADRYTIDPKDLIAAQKQARDMELEIVGFYHSHPDSPAQWSATDLAEAHWLGCSYVITCVEKGVAEQIRSFVLHLRGRDKYFEDEAIDILSE